MCQSNIAKCLVCGKEFDKKPRKANKYCSLSCYRLAQKRGDYLGSKGGPKKYGECGECGVGVYRPPAKNRDGSNCCRIFCSKSCYDKSRSRTTNLKVSICANCKTKVAPRSENGYIVGKYCSHNCRVEHKKPQPNKCTNCGVLFTGLKWGRNRKGEPSYRRSKHIKCYSQDCVIDNFKNNKARKEKISSAFSADKHPNWQGGTHKLSGRGAGWAKIAEEARERAGRRCEHCGMSEEENGRRLDVNHIIPFHQHKNKTQANRHSNLEALCRSCHTTADWKYRKENPMQVCFDIFD